MVEHFEIPGVPGEYFQCPYGLGVMSVSACAKNFALAATPESRRVCRLSRCDGCEVGCSHAGGDAPPARPNAGLTCSRCERPASRLIRGLVCVSCYNREREVLIGKNAKGKYPVKCQPVVSVAIAYRPADGRVRVRKMDRVTRPGEAINSVLATEVGPVLFFETTQTPVCCEPQGAQGSQQAA